MNRLSRYCDGIIEASWLMAIIVTTLAINNYTERTFEAMKVLPLRSIVWIALAAWCVKIIVQGGLQFKNISRPHSWKDFLKLPLAAPVAGLFLSILLSLIFSISFPLSLNGSYFRAAGALTDISYILFFLLVAVHLRRREQFERVFATLAFSSFLVASYAIIQRLGLDPYYWTTVDVSQRAASTIGHPIFAAAFMTMAFYILAGKTILALQDFLSKRASRAADLTRVILYGLIALLNLVAIWFAGSRGPLLGFIAGLSIFVLFLFSYWKMKRAVQGVLAFGAIGILFLVLLNLPAGPLSGLRDAPWVGPLGRVFEAESGTGQVRTMVWDGMARLVSPHAPIQFPTGESDRWNLIRPLVGYGPDTLSSTFEGYYNPQIYLLEATDTLFDRAHNHFWDMLAFYGILGTFAKYGLFLGIFFYILDWLGWLTSPSEKRLYWGLSAAGALAGGVLAGLWAGAGFVGLGLPAGALTGLAGIFIRRAFGPLEAGAIPAWRAVLLICFLSAIVSNYIELLFGIAVVNTTLLFWLFCALALVIGIMPSALEYEKRSTESPKARRAKAPLVFEEEIKRIVVASGVILCAMIMMGYWLIYEQQVGGDVGATLTNALTSIPTQPPRASAGMLWMFLGFLAIAPLLLQMETDSLLNRKPSLPNLLLMTGAILFLTILLWSLRASQLITVMQRQRIGDTVRMADAILGTFGALYFFLLLILLVTAFALSDSKSPKTDPKTAKGFPAFLGIFLAPVLALGLSVYFNTQTVYADVLTTFARVESSAHRPETALLLYERALNLAPAENVYLLRAYDVYIPAALSASSEASLEQVFQTGAGFLRRGYDLQPLYVNNSISLAYYYQAWSGVTADPGLRASRLSMADRYFQYALKVKPERVDYLVEWAKLSIALEDFPAAEQKIKSALTINPGYEPTYYVAGTLYLEQANNFGDALERSQLLDQALQYFQKDLELLTQQGGNRAFAQLGIARVYAKQEKYENAKSNYLQALTLNLADLTWRAYAELADVCQALNDPAAQRQYLQQAIAIAPADQIPVLQAKLDATKP